MICLVPQRITPLLARASDLGWIAAAPMFCSRIADANGLNPRLTVVHRSFLDHTLESWLDLQLREHPVVLIVEDSVSPLDYAYWTNRYPQLIVMREQDLLNASRWAQVAALMVERGPMRQVITDLSTAALTRIPEAGYAKTVLALIEHAHVSEYINEVERECFNVSRGYKARQFADYGLNTPRLLLTVIRATQLRQLRARGLEFEQAMRLLHQAPAPMRRTFHRTYAYPLAQFEQLPEPQVIGWCVEFFDATHPILENLRQAFALLPVPQTGRKSA